MEFWVTLIDAAKKQSAIAAESLSDNCTHIDGCCWIFEGEIFVLEEDGIKFNEVAEGAVPCLGGLSKSELVDLCDDVFGVDVYKQAYSRS